MPLKLISCNDITSTLAGSHCDGAKGTARSYKIHFLNYNVGEPEKKALETSCINETGASSITSSSKNIPAGPIGNYPFHTTIEAFSNINCLGSKKVFIFKDGLVNGSLESKVFSSSGHTELFLRFPIIPPSISYPNSPYTFNENIAITSLTPINLGGNANVFTISSPLPDGLALNGITGEISGTPSVTSSVVSYTVAATGAGGSDTYTFDITVVEEPPQIISYSLGPASYVQGGVISNNAPSTTGGGATSWSISPDLPTGLSFNLSTGVISGTPSVASPSTNYTITATNSGGSSNYTLNLEVLTPAVLTISETDPYNYGMIVNGSIKLHTFTISHSGQADASTVSEIGLAAPYSFVGGYPGSGGTCGTTINSSCTIVVQFNPTTSNTYSDAITLSYFDGFANQTAARDITGSSQNAAILTISESDPYDFGSITQGASVDFTFTISNVGDFAASTVDGVGLDSPLTFKGGSYPGIGGDCNTAISAPCNIVVEYAPTIIGASLDTIDITYDDGGTIQTSSRNIRGTGISPALLIYSVGGVYDFNFHPLSASPIQIITVSNTGQSAATLLSASGVTPELKFTGGVYPGTNGTCGPTLAASASCDIEVIFVPSGAGSFVAPLKFELL